MEEKNLAAKSATIDLKILISMWKCYKKKSRLCAYKVLNLLKVQHSKKNHSVTEINVESNLSWANY